jgi:hypothetical protein|tara:strand:+ start:729 stop:1004 length:276 start_codon:yes stop_codon:yes gene_type:complete
MFKTDKDVNEVETIFNLIDFLSDIAEGDLQLDQRASQNAMLFISNLEYIFGLPENNQEYLKLKDDLIEIQSNHRQKVLRGKEAIRKLGEIF